MFKRIFGLVVGLCLLTNQVLAENRFAARTCENYENDLSTVDQFLRQREVEVRVATDPAHPEVTTPQRMKIKDLEDRRAKLYAQRALIEGIELLRQRHLNNLAYLNNEKHCDFYPKAADRAECNKVPSNPAFPPKSFFELEDEKAIAQLDQKLDKARSDATNVYGMEQTINKLLGSQNDLNTLLAGANPPADGALVASLTTKCNAATSATEVAGLCAILRGGAGDSTNAAKYAKLVEVLNNFGKAFYYGYKYKTYTEETAQRAARDEAQSALRNFQKKLAEAPLNGGTNLLTTMAALDNFGNAVKKKYLKSVDCTIRKARFGSGLGSGTTISQIQADIRASGSGYAAGSGSALTGGNPGARIDQLQGCEVSVTDRTAAAREEGSFRETLRTNLHIANEGTATKFSLSSDYVLGANALSSLVGLADRTTTNHREAIQGWLRDQQVFAANSGNSHPYLFDRSESGETENSALTMSVIDPTRPSSGPGSNRKISQGSNLRQLLVQTANRAMFERKLNSSGADRVVNSSDVLTTAELANDTSLARHFLKQILLYQGDIFGGALTPKCPGPTLMGAGAIGTAASNVILTALQDCLAEVERHYNRTNDADNLINKKANINLELDRLNAAYPEATNLPAIGSAEIAKTRELRKKLAMMVRLKCNSSNLNCIENGRSSLNSSSGDHALRYLLTSSGSILARLAPEEITAASSEAMLRGEISTLCSETIPAPTVVPPATAPATPAPRNLRGHLASVCTAHDPVAGSPVVPTAEYSREDRTRTSERLTYLSNNHVTYLPDGSIATSSPAAGWGTPILLGTAGAVGSVILPTLMTIPGIQAETRMLVEDAKWQKTWSGLQVQNTTFFMNNGGALGFGDTFIPFAAAGGVSIGAGFNPAGDAGYGSYLSNY
ncbi:MAG: hypothetical protein A2X86_03960 [Bdellovibrionales bacterium GWA2_49_15]|nr:MAG: hypothetical protein A2X86_03960 [Bdellovibrionales bacterium GWA2_49_15]HAZ12372.1 hypothetical protein [Bdellovibrionales bacterium]